jgi:hypothetical protein
MQLCGGVYDAEDRNDQYGDDTGQAHRQGACSIQSESWKGLSFPSGHIKD